MNPVWDTLEFRELLAQRQPGKALALVRGALGISQEKLAQMLAWDRNQVGRVERGESHALRDVYELGRVADALNVPRLALLPALLETPEVGTIEITNDRGVGDMDRRRFGQASALLVGASVVGAPLSAHAGSVVGTVGAEHVQHVRDITDRIYQHDDQHGGGDVAPIAAEQFGHAQMLLDQGRYDTRTGLALASAVGALGMAAGWTAFDAGDQAGAQRYYLQGLMLAERASDDSLAGFVVNAMRWQAAFLGRAQEALQLSLRASARCQRDPSARLHAVLAAREAVSYAAIGDARQCDRAMAVAWREVDGGLEDRNDDRAWLSFVTADEIRMLEAQADRHLGRKDAAVDLYRECVDRGGYLPRDEASYRAYFAGSLAGLGDASAAISEGRQALSILESEVRSPRLIAEMAPVYVAAQSASGDEAQDFRERFETLTAA